MIDFQLEQMGSKYLMEKEKKIMDGTAKKEPQVTEMLLRQQHLLEDLANLVDRLEDSLAAILRPGDGMKTKEEPEQELVLLASQIRDSNHKMERLADRIGIIINRLEV